MYSKYTLFYESSKNWGYCVHAQTVCTRPLLGGEGPGDEARIKPDKIIHSPKQQCQLTAKCNPGTTLIYIYKA